MTTATLDAPETETAPLQVTIADFDPAIHDGVITLVSPKTGDHRTFRIRTIRHSHTNKSNAMAGKRVVELLEGPDNTECYRAFAFVLDGSIGTLPSGTVACWHRYRGAGVEKSQYERFADLLNRREYWEGRGVEFAISLKCKRCGRDLTHPQSLADGVGPICREKMGL